MPQALQLVFRQLPPTLSSCHIDFILRYKNHVTNYWTDQGTFSRSELANDANKLTLFYPQVNISQSKLWLDGFIFIVINTPTKVSFNRDGYRIILDLLNYIFLLLISTKKFINSFHG